MNRAVHTRVDGRLKSKGFGRVSFLVNGKPVRSNYVGSKIQNETFSSTCQLHSCASTTQSLLSRWYLTFLLFPVHGWLLQQSHTWNQCTNIWKFMCYTLLRLVERMILGCVIPQQIKKKIKRFREHEYMHKILSAAVFVILVRNISTNYALSYLSKEISSRSVTTLEKSSI